MADLSIDELAKLAGAIAERWPGCTACVNGPGYEVRDATGAPLAWSNDLGKALRTAAALALCKEG